MTMKSVHSIRLAIGRVLWWFVGPAHNEADRITYENSVIGRFHRRQREELKAESERRRRASSAATAPQES